MNHEALMKFLDGIVELRETMLAEVVPAKARQHFLSSRREALLGMSAVLEHAIASLEQQASGNPQAEKRSSHPIEIAD